MTTAVRQILDSFDALSDADKHQAALEILRRVLPASEGDVPAAALLQMADTLFLALDEEESAHAQS